MEKLIKVEVKSPLDLLDACRDNLISSIFKKDQENVLVSEVNALYCVTEAMSQMGIMFKDRAGSSFTYAGCRYIVVYDRFDQVDVWSWHGQIKLFFTNESYDQWRNGK